MPIMTTDYPALTDDLQEIYNEAASAAIAEMVGFQVFNVKNTDRRTFDYLILHSLDVVKSVSQGADLPVATSDEGDTATWTQKRYGGAVAVTKDMRMFDLYDEITSLVQSATEDAFDKIDQSLADVLLFGWSSSYTDIYDDTVASITPSSQTLFNTAQTNGVSTSSATYRNQIRLKSTSTENPAVSRQAIVDARVDARTYKDPEGHKKPIKLDTLVNSPSKEDLTERILFSQGVQGTPTVDSNPLNGKVKQITWERLEEDGQGTDKSAYWFMYDSRKVGQSLKTLFAQKPDLAAPEQVYINKNWEYSIDYYYAIGRGFPAYVRGSKGTNEA